MDLSYDEANMILCDARLMGGKLQAARDKVVSVVHYRIPISPLKKYFCDICRYELELENKFCPNCGQCIDWTGIKIIKDE